MNKRLLFIILASLFIVITLIYGLEAISYIIENRLGKFLGATLISVWSGIIGYYIIKEEL